MSKRKNPPPRVGGGALPISRDPRIWATAAVRLAKAIGVVPFVAVISLVVFTRWGMASEHMIIYGLLLLWSLYAMHRLGR
jgi:hypothetical protein